jgi:hypothetical protein
MTDAARTTTVLLEHTLPDGSAHFDWLIERPDDPREHRTIAFRCATDPLADPAWTGDRLPDHRAHYLRYEGPVPGGRGSVRRCWSHPCVVLEESERSIRLTVSMRGTPELAIRPLVARADAWGLAEPPGTGR